MTPRALALFDELFSVPRDPRSAAYKTGVLAALKYRLEGESIHDPFHAASAESDAFSAGLAEGHAAGRRALLQVAA